MPEDKYKNTEPTVDSQGVREGIYITEWMTVANVEEIFDVLASEVNYATQFYPSLIQGFKYDEMNNSLIRIMADIAGGPHKEIARRNPWLKKDAQKFLNEDNPDTTPEDRAAVVSLYKVATQTGEVMKQVSNYLRFAQTVMEDVTSFFCFHRYMQSEYNENYAKELESIFDAYLWFCEEFKTSDIYNVLHVKKLLSFEDNYNIVVDYMDQRINQNQFLSMLFADYKQLNAGMMNEFRVVDMLTGAFKDFDSAGATAANMVNDCDQIKAQLTGLCGQPELSVGQGYFRALRDLVEKIGLIFVEMDNAVKAYKKGEGAPYCMMKYCSRVNDVASKHLFESVGDPCSTGTEYYKLAKKMLARNKEMATTVAKNAAKWATD